MGAAQEWEGNSEPRAFHHANGRVGFISAYTRAPGQAGNAWFLEAGPPPAPTQLPLPHPPPLGRIQRCALPPDPRNVLFCTALDAAPGPCLETSLSKSASCHRWPETCSWRREHPQRPASINERVSQPGKVKSVQASFIPREIN